jgi:hypothetical protein
MKKVIAVLLVGIILLISANSVLAYERFCDDCGVIVDGYDECYRRTEGYYDCYYKTNPEDDPLNCPGQFWHCFTDWCCIYGHGTWTSRVHVHGSAYHISACEFMNGTHCPY